MNRKAVLSWCLYDWANSAFPTLISTFVFAIYFTQGVAETPEAGTAQWGWAMAISGLTVAVLGPILGAISDRVGRRKPWLAVLSLVVAATAVALWTIEPDPSFALTALVLVAVGTVAFELSMVFYNAMLTDLAPEPMTGRVSGWGWGLGYAGGLSALSVSLVFFVLPDQPLFGLDKEASEHIRIIPVLAGLWLLVFCLPLFRYVPERPGTGESLGHAVRNGMATLWATIVEARRYGNIVRFLIARMFYIDGLNTLFAFGGIFAAAAFGMDTMEVLLFGIALNVTAGLGAASFAFLDDRWGPKPVIGISVAAIAVLGVGMLLVEDKTLFWALGLGLGIFLGPTQSASRSMMARLAPKEMTTEFFGLYALSGKATAFLGPAILGLVTELTQSQHWGMATIFPFLIVGLVLLKGVRAP
jgi:UMF1 family MFS transporter